MSTLIIRDIARSAELSRNEMSAVRGGTRSLFPMFPLFDASSLKVDNSVAQFTQQSQTTIANTGVNVADAKNIHANVNPHQSSSSNSTVNIFSPGQVA
jgi:hypothetical protein